MWKVNIDVKKLYLQLFNIFEGELNNIFEYVAPIEENSTTCWNRIHELLLRLWAEVENLAKEVCNDIAKNEWESAERINSANSEKFLKYLINKISIDKKTIKFIWWLERGFLLKKPFSTTYRWTHYDSLKHWKIEKYGDCNLNDVIMAFWWYYILLNYLLIWYKWIWKCDKLSMINSDKLGIVKSSIYSPTFTYHEQSMNLEVSWLSWILDEALVKPIISKLESSDKMIKFNIDPNECLFCVYLKIEQFVTYSSLRQYRVKNLPNVPKIYQLVPVFSFINKGYPIHLHHYQ